MTACGMWKGLNNQERTLCFQMSYYSMLVISMFSAGRLAEAPRLRMIQTFLSATKVSNKKFVKLLKEIFLHAECQ